MATTFLVSLTLLGFATAGPLSSRLTSEVTSSDNGGCALQCSGRQNKFQYLPGTIYVYQYEVKTETSIARASEDSVVLNIQTHAEIEVVSSCEFSLHLKNTQVSHFDSNMGRLKTESDSKIQRFLERNNLRFSFDDGIIKTVCPELSEEQWVLNFKRGLLSAFQNSMKNFDRNQKVPEIDVTGHCEEVEYNVSTPWSWGQNILVVSKSKNLLSCSQRDGFNSFLQMVPYTVPSDLQSLPIIKSTHLCQQNINREKILLSSSCAETHVYVPFSNYQSGGRTVVSQKLTYQSKQLGKDTLQGVIESRLSLLFQHTNENSESLRGPESAEQKLKEICEQTTLDIRPETPRLFIELVQVVKTLKMSDLRGVYLKLRKKTLCPQNEKAMKFFIDALPAAGTPSTVEMILIIFKQDKVNEIEKQAWLLSLSLINDPTDEMMRLILKLVKEPMTLQALLPVSALVNNYCRMHVNCADNCYVSMLIDQLDENINSYCSVDDQSKQLVLRILRAVGNIGRSRRFVSTINRCIQSSYAPIEVKLSAIEAYRRIPCPDVTEDIMVACSFTNDLLSCHLNSQSDTMLVTTFQDKTAEPELRIASFQALMRCPTNSNLQFIVEQLNSEGNEEVGEYIYSYLTNLMKTSDPHKQDVARAVRRFNLEKKFELNILRSSRNYESSVLLNKFNLGYVADADLLWSKSSALPHAFKANLTMELFGNSINLLDFGGRMEGLEYLITQLVGPNDNLSRKDKTWSAEDLRLCLYGRIFGNELAYQHIEGDKNLPKKDDLWNIPNLLINWSKKFNYDFTHSMQLFHGSLIIPTIGGLPLHLTVNSSGSAHLHFKGQVEINKILAKQKSFNVDIDTLSSAGLEVTGTMLVDAHFRKVGIRMRNTLYGNLPLKGRSSLSPADGFSFELDAPEDKTELFDARSTFFVIYDNNEKEQKMITENRKEYKKCTGSRLAEITGFEMCGEFQFPNATMKAKAPYFPLTGPTSASLVLLKRDTHSGYKMFFKWDKKKQHTVAQFQLNMPGSRVNRLISTDVTLAYQRDKHIDVILSTPWKKLILNGKLISNPKVRRMVGTLRMDDEDYGLTTELKREKKNNEYKYTPLVEIIYKGETKTLISGQVICSHPKRHSLVLDVNGMDKPLVNIEVEARATKDPKRPKTSSLGKLKVKSSLVNVDLSSSTSFEKNLINSRLKVAYDIEGFGKENMRWSGKYSDKSKKAFRQYMMGSLLLFKKNSDYNLKGFLGLHQKRDTKLRLKLNYGNNIKNKNKVVTMNAQFPKSTENWKKPKVYGMMNLKVLEKNWDAGMKVNHLHDKGKIDSSMDIHFLPFMDKGTITAESKLNPKDFSLSAAYTDKNKKVYSLDVLSKMRNLNAGRWSVATKTPSRNVEAKVYFRREKEKITGDAVLNWDAGKKKKELSEISLQGSYRNSKFKNGGKMRSSFQLKSPFNKLNSVNLKLNLDQQPKRLKSNGKIFWGGKNDQISVDLVTSFPLSLSQVKVLVAMKSSLKDLHQIELDIDHELNKYLMTVLRGKMNNAESVIKVQGGGKVNEHMRNLIGGISLKTPYKSYKEMKVALYHNDDFKKYTTIAGLTHNSKTYKAEFDAVHDSNERGIVNTGKMIITSPVETIETMWDHHIEKETKKLASKLTSTSKNKKLINFEASGSYEDINSAQLQIDMTTKWKAFRIGGFQLNHIQNDKLLTTKAIFKRNREKTGYDLHLINDKDYSDVRLDLFVNPLYKQDISLRSNVKYVSYPMTASAQLEWAPRTKINFDGSLNAPSLDNFDLSSKLTTPFENYKNIHVKSSVKKDSSELIAHLNIDYAIQKMIDIETRYRDDDFMKLLSAKLTSPFTYIQSLDTAIQLETKKEVNAFKADFNLQSMNTYGSQIYLRKEKADLSGKIQVISPIEGYNFIEATGLIKSKRNAKRTLHLDFKQTPSKDYSLDLSYKTKSPLQLNLNVKTPLPEFNNIGLVFSHDWSQAKIVIHGSITYMSKKTVEVSLNLLVNPKIDGSLVVKTPFESFEHNEVNILYDGKMHDFTSHGSIIVGEEKFSIDLIFKRTSHKTSGDLILNSPYQNVRGKFMIRGEVQNMRIEALLQYGNTVLQIEFSNIIKKDSYKTNLKFIDPDKREFIFSIDHEDKSTQERRRIRHKQLWLFDIEETKLDATIDHKHYEDSQALINVISTSLPSFRNFDLNISMQRKEDFIDFSGILDTHSRKEDAIGLIFKSSGPIDKINSLFNLTWHDHPLIEVTVLTNKKSDTEMDGKVTIGGALLPEATSELKMVGDKSSFTSKSKVSGKAKFYHEVKYLQDDKMTEWDSLITSKYDEYSLRSDRVYFKRDLSDKLGLLMKWLVTIEHENLGRKDFGFEVDHKGNYDEFITSCNLNFGMDKSMNGKLDFLKNGMERVLKSAGITFPIQSLEGKSMKFRFERQDAYLRATLNLAYDFNSKEIVTTLLMQNSPHKIFTFCLELPKKEYTFLLLSAELEDGKAAGKITVENETKLSVLVVHSNSIYPYRPHIHLVTPWKPRDLTINLQGHLLDGSADATLLLNENDKVVGKAVLQYENLFTLTSSVSLDSTFENLQDLLLELKNTQDPVTKKSVMTISLSPENKISLSGDYLSKEAYTTSNIDKQLLLDVKLPLDKVQSMSLTLGLQADIDKVDGQIGFDINLEKVLDMDLNYNTLDKKSVSLTVQKPRAMEYSLCQNENGGLTENEIYLNWNRDEPESNIHIKSTYKDLSDSRKTDRAASLSLIHPVRSIGVEHSQLSSSRNVVSAGKLFWNTDDNSRLFYNFNLNDKSGRRFTFMDGEFIFGVPMRTLGVSGNFRKNTRQQVSDVSFSWDLDNDKSKKISLNTKVSGSEEVNADITLKLPAEVQVESKLILNKGNTIFDGTTDISYSWDDRKTLTLTSKLENNPVTYSLFNSPNGYNYSIQFGIRHPDTKVEMNFKSHVGQNDECLTGSLGLDYLTSYRQKKNIALWLEINKLKKQISLLSTNPYKNLGVTGALLRKGPLQLQAVAKTDAEENLKATLDVDYTLNKLHLGLGSPDKVVHLTAFYPNKSTFQVDIQHSLSKESHEDATLTVHLAAPRLVITDLNWRPEMIEEAQSFLIQMISQGNDELKALLSELSLDVEKEITRKYKDITSALSDDTKPLIDFVRQEMKIILQQINTFERKWNRAVRNNDLYLADIVTTVNRILESASLELIDIQEMSKASIRSLMKPLNSLSEQMVTLKNYPVRPTYRKVVNKMIETSTKKMDEMVQSLTESILDINNQISNLKELSKVFVVNSAQNLANHPWVEALTERLQLFKTFDVSPQLQKVMALLKDLIVEHESVKMLQEGSNEIYQQAKWAYNYWEIEENLPKLFESLLVTLQEVGEEEIAESLRHLVPYLQNPIIVFNPKTGLLKMAFILPFDVERLDEMPNLTKVMEDPTNALRRYIIDLGQHWPKWESNETRGSDPSSVKDSDIDFKSYKTDGSN